MAIKPPQPLCLLLSVTMCIVSILNPHVTVRALTDAQVNEGRMYATLADIRNDREFQNGHIVQGHAVIFNFFCRSLRTECPLLPSYLSSLPSSNAAAQRKLLSPCELRFSEKKLDVPDVCWPAKRNLDNLWAGLSGPPADFAIGIKNVFYRRVLGLGRHPDPRDCLDPKPFVA